MIISFILILRIRIAFSMRMIPWIIIVVWLSIRPCMFVQLQSIRFPVSCSMFITYAEIFSGKVPEDFGVSHIKGTSMTIPGQGSDLAQIIASIVKLPPLDERDFDYPAGQEVDERSAQIKAELDSMYPAEGRNLAEDAKARQEARKVAKNAENDKEKDEPAKDADAE